MSEPLKFAFKDQEGLAIEALVKEHLEQFPEIKLVLELAEQSRLHEMSREPLFMEPTGVIRATDAPAPG